MPTKALPLRAALIGLSSSATTSWASVAHLPGLLSETGRSKIAISALLNSSVGAAKSAIESYELPSETKAYGSPQDLAADPDIDLVICNTRVDRHYETIIDSVKAGKDVYVEWPVASNKEHIEDILQAAEKSGSRVAVGLQRRWVPTALKLRELLDGGNGTMGRVLSSEVNGFGGTVDRAILPTGLKYFAQKKIGGNPIVIGFAHLFDLVLSVVGEVEPSSVQTKLQLQRPDIPVRDPSSNKIIEHIKSDVPDLVTLHGSLSSSNLAAPNATVAINFRRGQPFPGKPSLTWTINCERGEIMITSPSTTTLEPRENDEPVSIKVHTFETNEVKDVYVNWEEHQLSLPVPARSVAQCLYAFADGCPEGDGWTGLESAVKRARLIDGFLGPFKV